MIADELRLCRIYLKNATDHASGKVISLNLGARNGVNETRFIRNHVEPDSEHFGVKSDLYFSKWLGRISIALKNSGIQNNKIENIITDNNDRLRRCCERLIPFETVVLVVEQRKICNMKIQTLRHKSK